MGLHNVTRHDRNMLKPLILALVISGAADAARAAEDLLYPVDVAVGPNGAIFVADHEAHALLKLDENGFTLVARGDGLPRTALYGIRHIGLRPDGRVVASDPATMKLYTINLATGTIEAIPDDDRFVTPWGLLVEDSGDILVVDRVTHSLRRVKAGSGEVEMVAEIRAPRAVLFGKDKAILVLTDNNLVEVEKNKGTVTPMLEAPPFEFAHDAVRHPNGNIYVTDGYARAVWQVTPAGAVSALVQGEPLQSPQGLAVDDKGALLIADAHAKTVFRLTLEGELSPLGK